MPQPETAVEFLARFKPYLGSTYVTEQTDPTAHAIMIIGKDRWSVARFVAEVGSVHLRAARKITQIAELHNARSLEHFYRNSSPGSVAETGFGVACFFTLIRTFASQGFDVTHWTKQKDSGWETQATTFYTFKKRQANALQTQAEVNQPVRYTEGMKPKRKQKGRRR